MAILKGPQPRTDRAQRGSAVVSRKWDARSLGLFFSFPLRRIVMAPWRYHDDEKKFDWTSV